MDGETMWNMKQSIAVAQCIEASDCKSWTPTSRCQRTSGVSLGRGPWCTSTECDKTSPGSLVVSVSFTPNLFHDAVWRAVGICLRHERTGNHRKINYWHVQYGNLLRDMIANHNSPCVSVDLQSNLYLHWAGRNTQLHLHSKRQLPSASLWHGSHHIHIQEGHVQIASLMKSPTKSGSLQKFPQNHGNVSACLGIWHVMHCSTLAASA